MNTIYADHGSNEFNARMHEVCTRIGDAVKRAVGDNFVALLLGGGYGRGEGGVVRVSGMEQPYNDLDFTLIVKRKNRVPWDKLNHISEKFEKEIHIDVDFSRPLTLRDVRNWPHWLMWHDLLNGHIVTAGDADVLSANAPVSLKARLRPIEATRLMLNRGAGLLWALRVARGTEPEPDNDFIRRNYYKCILAMGDALLIAHGRFATPYRGRDERIFKLEKDFSAIAVFQLGTLYEEALRFKFQPDVLPDSTFSETVLIDLSKRWGAVFLHVEKVRTGREWFSLTQYVKWGGLREIEQHSLKKIARNLVKNRQIGIWSWRYPRESLYIQLPVLLGLTDRRAQDWPEESARFLEIWDRFN